jgi:hypothetical protein
MPVILKQGLYRQNDILDNVTLYHTNMVIGKTFADVTGGGGTGGGGGVLGIAPPDHVVIVVEENHSFSSIIGSSAAPYINSLAQQGALFTQSFAVEHPSQPNYLDLFSGANQGVTDDSCPHTFSTENLCGGIHGLHLWRLCGKTCTVGKLHQCADYVKPAVHQLPHGLHQPAYRLNRRSQSQ